MEQLFGSKTRTKLLNLFMNNPNRSFFVREITRKIDEQINSVRRELANLLSLGLITSDSSNNKLYYEVNQKYEHYSALRELFTGKKTSVAKKIAETKEVKESVSEEPKKPTVVAVEVDKLVWDKVGNIVGLIYSGVFTRDNRSPVDVLIIGDVSSPRVDTAIVELEAQEGKELRYSVMNEDEWVYRRQVNDKFWSQVMSSKNQILIDSNSIFEQK